MTSNRDDLPRLVRQRLNDPKALCASLGLLDRHKRQAGGGITIRCPAHQESTPSCSVTLGPDGTLRWRCFACSASGDALTLVATANGLDVRKDFQRVLGAAADLAGVSTRPGGEKPVAPPLRPSKGPSQPTPPPSPDAETFDRVVRPLMTLGSLDGRGLGSGACEYLDGRGLLADARGDGWFAIGPSAGELLCDVFGLDLVRQCGLVNEWGALKWLEHSLAIPWRTPDGLVHTVQRRHLGNCEAAKRYVFPTGRGPAHPYGIERLASGVGPIAITEGAFDVLAKRRLDALGWTTVLGAPGVSGWRSSWDALAHDRIVTLAFDDDEAGNRESIKLGDRLRTAGAFGVRRSTPSQGKDWADALLRRCA